MGDSIESLRSSRTKKREGSTMILLCMYFMPRLLIIVKAAAGLVARPDLTACDDLPKKGKFCLGKGRRYVANLTTASLARRWRDFGPDVDLEGPLHRATA